MSLPALSLEAAERLAGIALGHVTREYPHKVDHLMEAPGEGYSPRAVHPVFYGSFDWHSCVHGYWLLARVRRLWPGLDQAAAIKELFERQLTAANVLVESEYLDRPCNAAFERPYGWAWLLMLAAELELDATQEGRRWSAALAVLRDNVERRLEAYMRKLSYPNRAGVHGNTAFAVALAAEFAEVFNDQGLRALLRERAQAWFGNDREAPAWEPSGDDFLSPTLMEAEAMRRVLNAEEFAAWFRWLLPSLAEGRPAALFSPAVVSDRGDGKFGHLDGLNLSRAWCFRSLASGLEATDARCAVLLEAAERHYAAASDHLAEDYAGEHWLASFALLAMAG